ncbi:MAG: cell division protein FtsZ [Elusimicrobiota bacterium]
MKYAEELKPLRAVIKVIGLGGAGGNAVNRMAAAGLQDVELIAANTDAQHLRDSKAAVRLQIGENLTEGLGVGGDPSKGRLAALESRDHLIEVLTGSHLVFVTAGMGGGTGTGVAPIAAQVARELNALTVGVVTRPFRFEGQQRASYAEAGIKELRTCVDTLLVIPNDRVFEVSDQATPSHEAYRMVDDVLRQAVQAISDVITRPGHINMDLNDLKAVMVNAGDAVMGVGESLGANRAVEAARNAIESRLLENASIEGASGLMVNIVGNRSVTMDEVRQAMDFITRTAQPDARIKFGQVYDEGLDDRLRITVIATGFPTHRRLGGRLPQRAGGRPLPREAAGPAPAGLDEWSKPAYLRMQPKKLR